MNIHIYLVICFCLFVGTAFGQTVEEIEQMTVEVNGLLDQAEFARVPLSEKKQLAEKALSIARALRDDGGIVRSSMMLARLAEENGQNAQALEHYLEAEERLRGSMNTRQLAAVYHALGDLFFRENVFSNARGYYEAIMRVSPTDYSAIEKAGDAAVREMKYDTATAHYQNLVNIYRDARDLPSLVKIYQKLATAAEERGDIGKSLYYYLRIEDIVARNGTPPEKAILYNNLGKQYARTNDYPTALEYFNRAENQCSYIPCDYMEVLYANIGIALHNTGKTASGIVYLKKAKLIFESRQDIKGLANLEHLMAGVYFRSKDYYNALSHNDLAMKYAQKTKQPDLLANTYETAADLYLDLYDFENAVFYYRKYLKLQDSLRRADQAKIQRLNQERTTLVAAEGQIKTLIAQQNIKDLELRQANFDRERLALSNQTLAAEVLSKEKEALLQIELNKAAQREALVARQQLRLAAQALDGEKQDHIIAALRQQEIIERAERQADSTRRAQEVEILRKDKNISDLERAQQATFRRFVNGVGILGIIILGLLGYGYLIAQRSKRNLAVQNEIIAAEQRKSDQLLRNILPDEIAEELKSRGYANPRFYDSATVLFTDFMDFTKLSSQLSPQQLIDELDECFNAFDVISEKHGLEKIKTIGDAYMCAGGLPVTNDSHPHDAVKAALEMVDWLRDRRTGNPLAHFIDMRIGIHTGPVVAGVVGKYKFAYDIWGDAVNLAARLEQLGEPGRINISKATYDIIRDTYECVYRGKKDVHNKGEVDMYFIVGPKPALSANAESNHINQS